MVPHYGKREAGLLTAASPGDTLHFNFTTFNDSGNTEAPTGFAVTDVEVFKDGQPTARATDSGYSLISDTGQMGERQGLNRFSVQLFNTADDASFYASGSWYQVAVDSIQADGKTVRFWVGSFEIGRQKANTVELVGDTGAANWLKQTFAAGFADTGINQRLAQIQSDVDTGLRVHIDDSDTGIKDVIADLDTGLRDYIDNTDTGLRTFLDHMDTGLRDTLADLDTGLRDYIDNTDTGLNATLTAIQTQTDKLDFDTGNELKVDVRKVNNVTVQGSGANGNEWRPGS
jgi:hypothetical protein